MSRVIVASFHVVVPVGTTLKQWERIEGGLRECMAAYGVSHLTVGPEISIHSSEGAVEGISRSACTDLLGCCGAVISSRELLRRRRG